MPDGLIQIITLLAVGYILLMIELFVPGGVVGVLGGISIVYGCYLAFQMGTGWGLASLSLSVVVAALLVRMFLRSRAARRLILADEEPKQWKAQNTALPDLVGRSGKTLSALRPAGLAQIGDQRVDVVSDSEFLDAGVRIRVVEVEGNRVVVEAAGSAEDGDEPAAESEPPVKVSRELEAG